MTETAESDAAQDARGAEGASQFWQVELAAAHRRERVWREERAPKVVRRFRDERDQAAGATVKTNILWSNTEILKSAIITEAPSPDVRRRFSSRDAVGRSAALVIERALSYCADAHDMDRAIEATVDDVLLPGRGVAWVVYEPVFAQGEDGAETIVTQEVVTQYVYWEDYREGHARTWADMPWVGRRHLMTREELGEAFPEHDDAVGLDSRIEGAGADDHADTAMRAEVWEIWDRQRRQRVWVAEGYPTLLRVDDDPYGLRDFFPCPEPVYAIQNTASRVPLPLYSQYQDQAGELDRITDRINTLVEQIRWRGVYDGSEGQNAGLKELANAPDGHFEGVQNWSQFQAKGGLNGVFEAQENGDLVEAVRALFAQREQLLDTIYQITGISDIVRGASDPRETKGAQQLKSQFASLRIQRLYKRLNRFIRDLFRIKGELIAEHFGQERLAEITQVDLPTRAAVEASAAREIEQGVAMAGQAVAQNPASAGQVMQQADQALAGLQQKVRDTVTWEDVVDVLRSDDRRANKIDIETDQTAFQDARAEKEARLEFVGTITGLLDRAIPAMQGNPTVAPFMKELVLFAARAFKVGRVLEESMEDAFDRIQSQPRAQGEIDPAALKAQAEIGAMQARAQIDGLMAQGEMQMKREAHALDMEGRRQEAVLDTVQRAEIETPGPAV